MISEAGMLSKGLRNRTAIVTGAAGGIGRVVALTLAQEGADLLLADVQKLKSSESQYGSKMRRGYEAVHDVSKEIKDLGRRAIAVNADVRDKNQVKHMVDKAMQEFGRIDILVNCAGVITYSNVVDLTEKQWDLTMDINVKGIFLCCKYVVPHMIKRRNGKIINISSAAGKTGFPGLAHYCASKFAAIGFTQSLASELAMHNINVNAVCPGIVQTKMWEYLTPVYFKREFNRMKEGRTKKNAEHFTKLVKKFVPLGRPQTPLDIAHAVLFLCEAPNITGESINISGGEEVH